MGVHCHSFGEGKRAFGIILIEVEEMGFDFMRVENPEGMDFIHEFGDKVGVFF